MRLSGSMALSLFILLVGDVVSLPTKVSEKPAFVSTKTKKIAKEETFVFRQPDPSASKTAAKLELLQIPKLRGSATKSALREEAVSTSDEQFSIVASHSSARSFATVGVCLLVLLLSVYGCCTLLREKGDSSSARPREDFVAATACDGTWARSYKNATDQNKQALELLYRCHIIPSNEFANGVVSQEHIDECVWITSIMIRQRPLEEWLKDSAEAQKTFEESVTACFGARLKQKGRCVDNAQGVPQEGSQTSQFERLGALCPEDDAHEPFADPLAVSGASVHSLPTSIGSHAGPTRSPEDANQLISRVRELMAATDAQRNSWQSMPATSPNAPSQPMSGQFAPTPTFVSLPPRLGPTTPAV